MDQVFTRADLVQAWLAGYESSSEGDNGEWNRENAVSLRARAEAGVAEEFHLPAP